MRMVTIIKRKGIDNMTKLDEVYGNNNGLLEMMTEEIVELKRRVRKLEAAQGYEDMHDLGMGGDEELVATLHEGEAIIPAHEMFTESTLNLDGDINGLPQDCKFVWRTKEKSAQQRRDEIVERAKADVNGGIPNESMSSITCKPKYIVNKEKRTVVALIVGNTTGKVYERGIAKCAPDDCFNTAIGKAIALRRALGLPVPDEYVNAPQPTEVREGDVVQSKAYPYIYGTVMCRDTKRDTEEYGRAFLIKKAGWIVRWIGEKQVRVIDDSREGTD